MIDKSLNWGRANIELFCNNISSAGVIVDIGAGKGADLDITEKYFKDATRIAVEAYPPYQDILTSKGYKVISLNIECEKLPFEDNSVDIIICNQIMEHCKEIWWILHEITRVLKVGGSLIVGIPNLASCHNRFLLTIGRQPTSIQNNSAHVRGYTKSDFIKFLNTGFPQGYVLKQFAGSNFYPFPPTIAKPLAHLFPTLAWSIFFEFRKQKNYSDKGFLIYPVSEKLETNFYLGNV